ncbi:phage Gp37/Gp68 family protein [Streptomyces umbrinus]|uniref:phage Gp37/Gp68 family protein n=1 Tax=Streptomyces umbrinus TaxID=67370 RepID=UPI003C2D297F
MRHQSAHATVSRPPIVVLCGSTKFWEQFTEATVYETVAGRIVLITLRPERLKLPMTWRTPRRIFIDSMSDLFHQDIPDTYIARVFAVMALTPHHTYQVLSKRHGRMRSVLQDPCTCGNGHVPGTHFRSAMAWAVSKANPNRIPGVPEDAEQQVWNAAWPLPNVWLGVSVEDQKWADIRIPALLGTPAAVRFLSCEPLLGPVNLKRAVITMGSERGHGLTASYVHAAGCCENGLHGIDWVIAGGESGPRARPMHPQWARHLRDQCKWAGVPYFLKQWGEFAPEDHGHDRGRVALIDTQGRNWTERETPAPHDAVRMRRVGKPQAGRLLDGRHHDAAPAR